MQALNLLNAAATAAQIHQLQNQWQHDRRHRLRVFDAWRGCLGLVMLLNDPDGTQAHGDLAMVPNDQVTWLAMRDVPHFNHGSRHRAGVICASRAVAQLRHGMPYIDFSRAGRDSIDLGQMPFGKRLALAGPPWELGLRRPVGDTLDASDLRQFTVLNRLSAVMTRYAFFATDPAGKPRRPVWAKHRPRDGEFYVNPKPASWMPTPYLAFTLEDARRLVEQFAEDVKDRPLPPLLYDSFCRSLAEGLVLRATEPEVYCGKVSDGPAGRLHELRSKTDQSSRFVQLPKCSRILVTPGKVLESAQPWARVLPHPISGSRLEYPSELPLRWSQLRVVCGGPAKLLALARLWFGHQFVRLPSRPDLRLIAAGLVGHAVTVIPPQELWWDTAPALPHYDWETQAAVLPPIPTRGWDCLHLTLSDEVAVNASIVDPRWHGMQALPARQSHRLSIDCLNREQPRSTEITGRFSADGRSSAITNCGLMLAVAG